MNVLTLVLGPLQTNCYILYGKDKKAVVIDPAFYPDRIENELADKGLVLDKILLTHAHFDHIMAVEGLWKDEVTLYIHADDEEMFVDPKLNCMLDFMGKSVKFKKADVLLCDGDSIDVGGETLTVLHTPGHTKGSVCYISDEHIFSGDTLFKDGVGRCDLYGGSFAVIRESLKKIASLEKDYTVFPGHGEYTTLNYEKNNNIYMKL